MQSDNKKIITEKSVICTIGDAINKPTNPDVEKVFNEGQKHISIKVTSSDSNRSGYSKSNPNIVE
jgi:hypothetical protein